MDIVQKITQTIEPSLDAMGYSIVQIKMADSKHRKTLSIMAERKDEQNMGFDDCTQISRMVGALLEVEDPIAEAYNLEVCSPGLDRPLVKPADFIKYSGKEAKIETLMPVGSGRKRFRGMIKSADEKALQLSTQDGMIDISMQNIRGAKLVGELSSSITKDGKPDKKKKKFTN